MSVEPVPAFKTGKGRLCHDERTAIEHDIIERLTDSFAVNPKRFRQDTEAFPSAFWNLDFRRNLRVILDDIDDYQRVDSK